MFSPSMKAWCRVLLHCSKCPHTSADHKSKPLLAVSLRQSGRSFPEDLRPFEHGLPPTSRKCVSPIRRLLPPTRITPVALLLQGARHKWNNGRMAVFEHGPIVTFKLVIMAMNSGSYVRLIPRHSMLILHRHNITGSDLAPCSTRQKSLLSLTVPAW
jgi:hypothetical protein